MTTTKSTTSKSSASNWSARLTGALWLALILFALAGLLVVGKLPPWVVGLVVAAGVALDALLFLLRWMAKRRDPAYSPGRSFGASALGGALGMVVSGALGEEKDPANRVIVDFRNQTLARFVADSKADKIYITYGAAHFPGVFAELQKRDAKFEIRSVKGVRPMMLPHEVNLAPPAVSGTGG